MDRGYYTNSCIVYVKKTKEDYTRAQVIIPIVVLFIERGETKRPYVEVSFELVRSTMACLVIRNVGRVPAELKSMTFNDCFIQQLTPEKRDVLLIIYQTRVII